MKYVSTKVSKLAFYAVETYVMVCITMRCMFCVDNSVCHISKTFNWRFHFLYKYYEQKQKRACNFSKLFEIEATQQINENLFF